MFIIERPKYKNGIYAIVNIVEKRVYIGESIDMAARAVQHCVIASSDDTLRSTDNTYLASEKNKYLWGFTIGYIIDDQKLDTNQTGEEKKASDKELKDYLRLYERLFMYMIAQNLQNSIPIHKKSNQNDRNKNPALYNIIGNKPLHQMEKDIHTLIKKYNATHTNRCRSPFALRENATPKEIDEAIICVLKQIRIAFDTDLGSKFNALSLQKWNILSRDQRVACWNHAVDSLEKNHRFAEDYFVLDETKPDFWQAYTGVCDMLSSPCLSKRKAKSIEIDWDEKSIFDPELIKSIQKLTIVSKFGSHNNETPYEILLKMKMDIEACGFSFWALKNLNEDSTRKLITQAGIKDNEPVYALFTYTGSDSTNKTGQNINLNAFFTRDEIRERDRDRKLENAPGLMNWWRTSKKEKTWSPIDDRITYITIPEGKQAVGLRVKNFWFSKEVFSNKQLYTQFKTKLDRFPVEKSEKELSDTFSGSCSVTCARLKDDFSQYKHIFHAESDLIGCLIVELEYPYVVQLSHNNSGTKNRK